MKLALALCLVAGMAGAVPPETSLRPVTRMAAASARSFSEPGFRAAAPAVRPLLRPGGSPAADSRPAPVEEPEVSVQAAARSLRPAVRTPRVTARAVALRRERQLGAVCGNPEIQGDVVGRVAGRISGCGIEDAVRVRSVAGVALTQRAVMDCGTAGALNRWVGQSAKPALSGIGGGLSRLKIAAHYSCRSRNGLSGARISEHGKGRAIDISGFHMRDGSLITVERGWTARASTQALHRMHRGACGPFGTVLGPESDSFHRDHFHFDTARYRSGSYCR